jgi:hypothetical protein
MALVEFSTIDATLAELFFDEIANQINRAVVLGQVLDITPGTGKNIQWSVRTGTATPTTAVIADGADVSTFNNDAKSPAVLQYGTYHDAFSVTGKAMAAARAAGNPAELAALMVDELGDSVERLARAIANDIYVGTGATDNIWGLYGSLGAGTVDAIGDTGVYAGVDRGSVAQWQGNVVDALGVDFQANAFSLMRNLRREIYTASGERPDIFVTDPAQHEKLGLAYQAERRYTDEVRRADGTVIKLDGGYQVLEFDGIPVIEDVLHPVQKVTALNSRHVKMSQLIDSPDVMNRAMGTIALAGTPEEQLGQGKMKLYARIQPLAVTGDAFKYALYVYPQLCVKRPNSCGFLENLAA